MNAGELIQYLGGPSKVAAKIGVLPSTVSNWRSRGVPWDKRHAIAELAEGCGLELPDDFHRAPSWGAAPEAVQ